jgi:arabinofuranosyltransferase
MRATRSCVTADRRDDLLVLLAAALSLTIFLVRERMIAGAVGFPLDDSWIHLHFARNLAEGAGFAYNPGAPVAGSTAPLWTLLLAAGARVAGASLIMAKTLGIAAAVAAALLLRRAALAWGASRPTALVAAIALCWSGPFVWGALSGMEVTLAAMLVTVAMLALARDRVVLTAVAGALATLARPEAIVLLPLLALARQPTAKRLAVFAAIVIVVLVPFMAFCWATTGTPIPATASAKVEGGLLGRLIGIREAARLTWIDRPLAFASEWIVWLARTHPLLPLALPLIALAWRRSRALGLVGLVLLVHPLAMAILAPYRGPGFQEGRYSIHLLPVALLVLAAAWTTVADRFEPRRVALASALRVLYLAVALVTLVPAANRYAWGVQNINAMQVHLGHWVDEHLPRTATLAVNDIGAIAYVSRRPVIDLMGLVTPEIRPYRREGEMGVLRFIAERCPDAVIIFPTWFPEIAARRDLLVPIYSVRLERNEVSGGTEMVVYRLSRCAV